MRKILPSLFVCIFSLYLFSENNDSSERVSTRNLEYYPSTNSISVINNNGATSYEFDLFNQLKRVELPDGKEVQYFYDYRNNLSKLVYPDHSEIEFSYDLDNRLVQISQGSEITLFEYDNIKNQLVKKTFPNGIAATYCYNSGKVDCVTYFNSNGEEEARFCYEFDANGNRTKTQLRRNQSSYEVEYKYDKLSRLIEANYSDGYFEHFSYDALGNRLSKLSPNKTIQYTYNTDNQLIEYDDVKLHYDSRGNLKKKESKDKTANYFFDERNLLLKVEEDSNIVEFEYDYYGNRTAKIVNGTRTNYINDQRTPITNVLVEETESEHINYCYAAGVHSSKGSEGSCYYLFDSPNRNVAFVADKNGSIRSQYTYEAFGKVRHEGECSGQNNLFSGQQYDVETGLIYLRKRYYDPELGRFISPDVHPGTIFYPQTLNPYTFVLNNPINLIDLTGMHGELPPEGMVFYDICAYDRVPWHLHRTYTGHGWQEFTNSDGVVKSIGHYPLKEAQVQYYRVDEHLRDRFPQSRIATLCFTVPETVANTIMQATESFCSAPYSLFSHNCIDAVKAGMDAAEISHPDFKAFGISDPLKLHHYIQFQNFKTSVETGVSNFIRWFSNPNPGTQGNVIDNSSSFHFNPMYQPDLGGVSLSKKAEMLSELPGIKGVVYDMVLGQMVFFDSQNSTLPKMNFDDLAVAIRSLYGLGSKPPAYPGVSIDSTKQPEVQSVRYDGATEKTHFGWVMFEADRLLKCLVAGIDNQTGKRIKCSVRGYKSVTQRYQEAKKNLDSREVRFWFIPGEIQLELSNDGKAIVFSKVKMKICHESVINKAVKSDPYLEAFAKHFTDHFDAYAKEFPIFQELLELGKITATIKWIQDSEIPLDLDLFKNYIPVTFNTPNQTNTIATAFSKHGKICVVSGGVIYACSNKNTHYNLSVVTDSFEKELVYGRPEDSFSWEFDVYEDDEGYAHAIPWLKTRKPGNYKRVCKDMTFPMQGNHELKLVRVYDSFYDSFSLIGYGWRILPYRLVPLGVLEKMSFEDRTTSFAYKTLLLQEERGQKVFNLVGIDSDNNLIYSCEKCIELVYLLHDSTYILAKGEGKNIFFSQDGFPLREEDSNGINLYYQYQGNYLKSIKHQSGHEIELFYRDGKLSEVYGPGGAWLQYQYDHKGQLEKVSNKLGIVEQYRYDQSLRVDRILDGEMHVLFEGKYDDYNRLTSLKQSGIELNYSYDLIEKTMLLTLGSQIINETAFSPDNHLISNSGIMNQQCNYSNQLIEHRDGWQYEYDDKGNTISIIDPLGRRTVNSYDPLGNLRSQENPNGNITRFIYDDRQNLRKIYNRCDKNSQGMLTVNGIEFSEWNDIFFSTELEYDEWGNLSLIKHATGPSIALKHNANGMIQNITTSMGYTTFKEYDEGSRVKSIDDPNEGLTLFDYDEIGRLKYISKNGREERYSYYLDGRIHTHTDPNGNQTKYSYDILGRLKSVVDAENIQTLFEYDREKISFVQSRYESF